MKITKWLHIQELGSDQWVLPIYTAWHRAADQKRMPPLPSTIGEAGLAITTRLNLLPRITKRLQDDFGALAKDIIANVKDEHTSARTVMQNRPRKITRCSLIAGPAAIAMPGYIAIPSDSSIANELRLGNDLFLQTVRASVAARP